MRSRWGWSLLAFVAVLLLSPLFFVGDRDGPGVPTTLASSDGTKISESPANVDAAGIFSPTDPSAGEQPANGTIIAPTGSNVTVLIRNFCGENDYGTLTFDPTTTEHFEAFVGDFNPYYYSLYNFTMSADSVFLTTSGGGCGQAIAWFALSVFIWPFLSAVGNGASGSYTIGTSCPDGYACVALGWVNPSELPSATGWTRLASSPNYASSESSSYTTTAAPYSLTPTGGDGVVVLIGDATGGGGGGGAGGSDLIAIVDDIVVAAMVVLIVVAAAYEVALSRRSND
ncbi:MAG: hypothetical protein WBF81_05995 [Thermoplasmata archaeon]